VPDDYVTPSFPSLYSPSAESTLSNTGHFLYQAYSKSKVHLFIHLESSVRAWLLIPRSHELSPSHELSLYTSHCSLYPMLHVPRTDNLAIWRFTLYWTLILIGGTFFLCSIAAFLTALLSLTIFRRPPNLPPTTSPEDTEREKLRPKRKRPPLWPVLLIPLVWSALGAIVALISGTIVGFVLGAVYSAGGSSMSGCISSTP